jgi:septum formation protein
MQVRILRSPLEPIVLASGSPRRRDYFHLLGLPFTVVTPEADESAGPDADPARATADIAGRKIRAALELCGAEAPLWICAADTVVSLDGQIIGKPHDRAEAESMLKKLRGRTHGVFTSVALWSGRKKTVDTRTVESAVTFAPLLDAEIAWYLDTGEWDGVAGAYRAQGLAACFVESIRGSFSSVAGLPLRELYCLLRENGYPYGAALRQAI